MNLRGILVIGTLIILLVIGYYQIQEYRHKPNLYDPLDFNVQIYDEPFEIKFHEWETNSFILRGKYTYAYSIYKGFSNPLSIRNEFHNNMGSVFMYSSEGKTKKILSRVVPIEVTALRNEIIVENLGTTEIKDNISFKADFSNLIIVSSDYNFTKGDYIGIIILPNMTTRFSPVDMDTTRKYEFRPKLQAMTISYERLININESLNRRN
jgi:hypothetical protein